MKLFEIARDVSKNAYAPYSKFKVGCAIEMKDGTFISGCNVENVSFSLTNCAERTALFTAVSKGYSKDDVKGIAIYTNTDGYASPCGACRQVMLELLDKNTKVYLLNKNLEYKEETVGKLLPMAFERIE